MELPDPHHLHLVCYPAPLLHQRNLPVGDFGDELRSFAEGMLRFMVKAEGVGLAAPQIGAPIRLFVCNATGNPEDSLVFVNPQFVELDGGVEAEEGCLSVPGARVTMRRAARAVIEAQSLDGTSFRMTGHDLQARVWQHEMDHLDGRLIVDNMSAADEIANRRTVKQLKEDYQQAR
ncbi:MAG: peptide deformylase, partial [Planctomycetes bacterium]|nr:peptide deformylase [Planctomycetota bacterium]